MDHKILKNINSPIDVKQLNITELKQLAEEIRDMLINTVSQRGGHLASNLGVVELTLALHYVFDSPNDTLIFDVGHQCYTHKLLTGRYKQFNTLRSENGISGFPKPWESLHDPFITGHACTSVSLASGIAKANELNGNNHFAIAILGDGALSGGLVYEAFNNIEPNSNLMVVLNDNQMSISKNVGAMARHISSIRYKPRYQHFKYNLERIILKIPLIGRLLRNAVSGVKRLIKSLIYKPTIFEAMGFYYLGPQNGNDLEKCIEIFKTAKIAHKPLLIHLNTVKGKGYQYAEASPSDFHGISHFEIDTGDFAPPSDSFSSIFGEELCKIAQSNSSVCAITAAMGSGTGLENFAKLFNKRYFDVGIAEGHAVTFAAGLSKANMTPIFAVYSTFLQRSYDNILHDVALQRDLKVILAIDRAGFIGDDGETHQGLFDVSMLNSIPNVTVYSPSTYDDLRIALNSAVSARSGVFAIRYPKGKGCTLPGYTASNEPFTLFGNASCKNILISYGRLMENVFSAYKKLLARNVEVSLIKLNCINPIASELLDILNGAENIFIYEECNIHGGVGEVISGKVLQAKCHIMAVNDPFTKAMTVDAAFKLNGFCTEQIVEHVQEIIREQ